MGAAGMEQGRAQVLCGHCLLPNNPDTRFCRYCWSVLDHAISPEMVADRLQYHWTRDWLVRLNRRAIRLGLLGAAILVVMAYSVAQVVHLPVPGPSTQVNAATGVGQWGLSGGDIGHTGWAREGPLVGGELEWQLNTVAHDGTRLVNPPPAVADGTVYYPMLGGRLKVLDAADGHLLWEYSTGGVLVGAPAVTPDMVYLGLRDGRVLALDRGDGGTRWTFKAEANISTALMVYRGVLFAGDGSGNLHALDAEDGNELWSYDAHQWLVGTPIIYDNVVAVTTVVGGVHFVDRRTGRGRLQYTESYYPVTSSPAFGGHRLIMTTQTGYGVVTAIDATKLGYPMEGHLRNWRLQWYLWGLQGAPPVPKGFLWRAWLPDRGVGLGAPAVTDQQVFVVSADGKLHAFDVTDGTPQWTYDSAKRPIQFSAGARARGAPVVIGNSVYFGTEEGHIHVVDRHTGEEIRTFPVGAPVTGPLIVASDTLFTVTRDGTLHAFR